MTSTASLSGSVKTNTERVWDPYVRFAHWTLAIAFAAAYLSAEEEAGSTSPVHVWAGYAVGVLVAARVVWGFVGSRHARFADFVTGPVAALRYLMALVSRRAPRFLGHSPAGGAMVVALLLFLAGTVVTGLIAYGEQGKGPFGVTSPSWSSAAQADEESRGGSVEKKETGEESAIAELHGIFAQVTLGLIVLHVLGVGLASVVHRENLVASMIHGRKRSGA